MFLPQFISLSVFPLRIGMPVMLRRVHPQWPCFTLITSLKVIGPNKQPHSEVLGVRPITCEFACGGRQFSPLHSTLPFAGLTQSSQNTSFTFISPAFVPTASCPAYPASPSRPLFKDAVMPSGCPVCVDTPEMKNSCSPKPVHSPGFHSFLYEQPVPRSSKLHKQKELPLPI